MQDTALTTDTPHATGTGQIRKRIPIQFLDIDSHDFPSRPSSSFVSTRAVSRVTVYHMARIRSFTANVQRDARHQNAWSALLSHPAMSSSSHSSTRRRALTLSPTRTLATNWSLFSPTFTPCRIRTAMYCAWRARAPPVLPCSTWPLLYSMYMHIGRQR